MRPGETHPGVSAPTGARDTWYGLYRGQVADTADPEQRCRYRVRVVGVHAQSVPTGNIPWAELAAPFSAKLAGDVPHYEVGDLVWVMFEGGDRRHAVIVGGWVSRSQGLNDVPIDITQDYAADRYRWVRLDRAGNKLELSEVPGEEWARLVSGAAEVVCDQKDGSVTLQTPSGMVFVTAASVEVDTTFYALTGGQVIVQADAVDGLGGGEGILQLMATLDANLHAQGVVTIGGYLPTFQGEASPTTPGMGFQQTPTVAVRSRALELGTATGETLDAAPLPETDTLTVNGVSVTIESHAATNLPSATTVQITINSDGTVSVSSASKVVVQAPEVDVNGSTKVVITSPLIELV